MVTPTWAQRLWQDLQPGPGRLAATLRIVLATIIALVLMMVLQMPFASLGLYYIFLVVRESPATSVKSGVMAILTLILAVGAELAVVIVTDNDPTARLLSVAIATFIAGTLMVASSMPALAAIWGFIYCTLIALWETHAPADALVKASLYLIATVTLAFLCTLVVEYLFAFKHPADRLAQQLQVRYQTIAGVYGLLAKGASSAQLAAPVPALNRLAATGQRPMLMLYNAVMERTDRDRSAAKLPVGVRGHILMLAQLMDNAAAFASQNSSGVTDPELRARCAEIARLCRERPALEAGIEPGSGLLGRVETALHSLLTMPGDADYKEEPELVALPADNVPFLIPGALGNPDTIAFALKLTLCVMLCYVFYFAVAWPGISTSVTTIFITALGTSGAIKQKLANRFVGSAIGGALAIGATVFLFPYMDSIFSLVVLIGVVAFGAAWWAGGRQFGYAGLQIAFAFYLVAFEGFSAPTELTPPRDRLVGILVALFVIWVVFDQLWPVRTVTAMRRALAGVFLAEAKFLRLFEAHDPKSMHQVDGLRDRLAKTIAGLRMMNDAVAYEFGADREAHLRTSANILRSALTTVPFFWNQLAVLHREDRHFIHEPGLIEMRRKAAQTLEAMADAVGKNVAFVPRPSEDLADTALLESAVYGEYARNTIAVYQEIQASVVDLQRVG